METTKQRGIKKGDISLATCPSRGVLDLIADKWTVLIIHTLDKKTMRHNELARALGDISQKVLTQGLRKLERSGIITRTIYPVVPPRVEYALSPLGRSLIGVLGTLSLWAESHFPEVERSRAQFDNKAVK
jgi:DNA-binding HxlR family transcriptional regulator